MRKVRYPGKGKPSAVTQSLEELVMLLQASLEIANTERWAFQLGAPPPPPGLPPSLRTASYEVTVVDIFHRMIRDWVERQGNSSVWERPVPSGGPGAPPRIDVSLFDGAAATERRLELGIYSKRKLAGDASKLDGLRNDVLPTYPNVSNLVMLWEIRDLRLTDQRLRTAMSGFKADAVAASTSAFTVVPLMASAVDLFTPRSGGHRHGLVGLFEVS